MEQLDVKSKAYHVLVRLYFIWLPVFAILLALVVNAILYLHDPRMGKMLLFYTFLSMVIGTSLFMVLKLFGRDSKFYKVVTYSYFIVTFLSVTAIMATIGKV